MRIAVVFSTGTGLHPEPSDKDEVPPDALACGGYDKRLHFSGGIALNQGETLERRLKTVLSRIRMAASESDLVVLPDRTYFNLANRQRPQIMTEGEEMIFHAPFDTHIKTVRDIVETTGTVILLGSFQEEYIHNHGRFICNTALYITRSGVKPIRQTSPRLAFVRIPAEVYREACATEYFYQTLIRWSSDLSAAELAGYKDKDLMANELAGRAIQIDGKTLLPLLSMEFELIKKNLPKEKSDILAYIAADGCTPYLDMGFWRNHGSLEQMTNRGFRAFSDNQGELAGYAEQIQGDCAGLLKEDGVFVAADCFNANLAVFYPHGDKKVRDYRLHSSGVYGTID